MKKRRRLIADWNLQGGFCLRLMIYWFVCQTAMAGTIAGIFYFEAGGVTSAGQFLLPGFMVSLAFLPLAMLDQLILTNRILGPLHRFRQHLLKIADGESIPDLHFRPGDHLQDLSKNINRIKCKLNESTKDEVDTSKTIRMRIVDAPLFHNGNASSVGTTTPV